MNFPVEDGELLTQGEILSRERCSGHDPSPDEQKESGDEDHNGTLSGNYVKILGPNWRIQHYANMKKSNVRLLQFVRKGEKIGEVGDTGNGMGKPSHLRLSVTTILPHFWKIDDSVQGWKKSFYLNPKEYFAPTAE